MIAVLKFKKRFDKWTVGDVAGFGENDPILAEILAGDCAEVLEKRELCLENNNIDASWNKRVPKEKESLICPICGQQNKTKVSLTSHKKKAHNIA